MFKTSLLLCREKSPIGREAKQWIYWDPSDTRRRNDRTSPWFNFNDKYNPLFKFLDDSDDKKDFWISVAACMKNRVVAGSIDRTSLTLRLNQGNSEFPTSCLEESMKQNSSISPQISSGKNYVVR